MSLTVTEAGGTVVVREPTTPDVVEVVARGPAGVTSFTGLTGKPTTVAGYGITDLEDRVRATGLADLSLASTADVTAADTVLGGIGKLMAKFMQLATSVGASLIGYDGGTMQDIADAAKPMQSYTALRAYTGRATGVRITSAGIAGVFARSATDTTSADNGGTVIVDASGRRWLRIFVGPIHLKWFDAAGDGVADDSISVRNFIRSLVPSDTALGLRHGHIDAGIYRITTSGVLSDINSTSRSGMLITGDGFYASILRLDTSGSDLWFYDNGAAGVLAFASFSDIGFEGMDPALATSYAALDSNAKGFRLYSTPAIGSREQGFRFNRCRFDSLDVVESNEGTQTSSEIKYDGCKIVRIRSTVKSINNVQSFNHEYISTDIEQIYGDVFSIGANGGGAVKVYGGSIIMFDNGASDTYYFKASGSTGQNAYPCITSGARFELHGERTKLVNLATLKQFKLPFVDCHVLGLNATDQTMVSIGAYSLVEFQRTSFSEQGGGRLLFDVNTAALYGQSGRIVFDDCLIAEDWSDRCTISGVAGQISAINCRGSNIGALTGGLHYAHDFDLHWNEATAGVYSTWAGSGATLFSAGSPSDTQLRLKVAQIKLNREYWPSTTEHTLKLPKNAIIKAVHLRKPQLGANATVTQIAVGRGDKTGTAHLLTTAQAANLAAAADVDNYYYHVGSTANERTLRLYLTVAAATATQGGMAIVEYY